MRFTSTNSVPVPDVKGEYTLPVNIVVNGYKNISAKGTYQVNVKLDSGTSTTY